MNQITINDIVEAVEGTLLAGNGGRLIESLTIDSRDKGVSNLFIPIIGEKTDAHLYIGQALSNGAVATLTSEHEAVPEELAGKYPDCCWIRVNDTLKALHRIGSLCRSRVALPAVGVTGSVGKTTTREMIAHAMESQMRIFKTGKNYNSQIGVPITMSLMSDDYDYGVLELGMNVPGELGMISEMAKLEAGVITNIGVAHIEFFGTQDRIALEKLTICKGIRKDGLLFLNGDDAYLVKHAGDNFITQQVYFYGTDVKCDYYATDIVSDGDGSRFVLHIKAVPDMMIPVTLTVPGRHNVLNALAALAVCHKLGLDVETAAKSLITFKGFMNRLQIQKTASGVTVIDDTYNASPASMKSGLDVLCDRICKGRRIAVLGDMFELGENSAEYHYEVGVYAAQKSIDCLLCVGKDASEIARAVADSGNAVMEVHTMSGEDVFAYLTGNLKPEDIVYFKASNGMKFKALAARLQEALNNY